MKWRYKWNERLEAQVGEKASQIIGEIGLAVEGEAKDELYPGHGEDTSTLKKSIHTAEPGYNWAGDDIEPTEGAPERGFKLVKGKKVGSRYLLSVGSGMVYAMAQHQGFKHYRSGQFV